MSAALRIRRTGPLCLVEDLGRPGLSAIGVGRSGAADRSALCQANRALDLIYLSHIDQDRSGSASPAPRPR